MLLLRSQQKKAAIMRSIGFSSKLSTIVVICSESAGLTSHPDILPPTGHVLKCKLWTRSINSAQYPRNYVHNVDVQRQCKKSVMRRSGWLMDVFFIKHNPDFANHL